MKKYFLDKYYIRGNKIKNGKRHRRSVRDKKLFPDQQNIQKKDIILMN